MKFPRMVGHRRPGKLAVVAVAVVAAAAASAGAAQGAAPTGDSKLYLVQVVGAPLASYTGDIAGLPATKPAAGERVDSTSDAARRYRDHLRTGHGDVMRRVGLAQSRTEREYGVTFNGFAARLTEVEATRLSHSPGVMKVWPDEIVTVDTVSTPRFLGLDGPTGVWQQEFGGVTHAGEGMIIGVIDSGFWPESASFGPLPLPRPDDKVIKKKWHGVCDPGTEEPITCNNKMLGARWYNESGQATDHEYLSPRDYNGHGTHTASTAAGNTNVPATINGVPVGNISGMAPAARIASYKVIWDRPDGSAAGGSADVVSAIDDAVADGVDVINYSVSGSLESVIDPVEIAFFNAAAAGVFVATSAGNFGVIAGPATVAHNSPWVTTVAAGTHDRGFNKTVTLGNGATFTGLGVGPAVGSAPVVLSTSAGLVGAKPTQVRLCLSSPVSLDPAMVAGKIVVCDRGTNARTDKALAVKNAGGVGMILANNTPEESVNADYHIVPSIHVNDVAGAAIKAYVAGGNATATISAQDTTPVRAPSISPISSFGPALAGGGDLLKPDITAPGVDVIAAVAPPGSLGNSFNSLSGTSMSSPHIAGIAALIKSAHPKWSPMEIKSALMTTANPKDNTGATIERNGVPATPLNFGSGEVVPTNAFDPGLVYDSDADDWIRYGCALGQMQFVDPALCTGATIDPSDLNYPSIAVGDLVGTQTITRKVRNVTKHISIYTPTVEAPTGFTATVFPPILIMLPGWSATYKVKITRTTAALNEWAFGSLTWTDGLFGHVTHSVRSPIAIRPVPLAAPSELHGTGTSGSVALPVRTGFAGTLGAQVTGLTAASVGSATLDATVPFDTRKPAASASTSVVTVTIPAGTSLARFATFDADHPAGTDIDLFVYQVVGTSRVAVGASAGATAEETVTLASPAEGTYELYTNLFKATGATVDVKPNNWVLTGPGSGLTATPASQAATIGGSANITLNWSGLTAGIRYLGVVALTDGTTTYGRTAIAVAS